MYYTRKELLDRKWELADIQAFPHDKIKKSETGRGRPSYLYLVSRVEQKEKGLTVDLSEIHLAPIATPIVPSLPAIESLDTGKVSGPDPFNPFVFVHVGDSKPIPCSVPQAIREPMSQSAPLKALRNAVSGAIERGEAVAIEGITAPIRTPQNPNAVKLDLKKLGKGAKVILVDAEGNETLYQG